MKFALRGCIKLLSASFDYVMSGRLAKTMGTMKLLQNEFKIKQVLRVSGR